MFRNGETRQQASDRHTAKSINVLFEGAGLTTAAILFFSFQHLLPAITLEFSNTQRVTTIVAPLFYAIVEHYRQDYLANKAITYGVDKSQIRHV